MTKKALVTGGTGLLGRYLVDLLIKKNYDVEIIAIKDDYLEEFKDFNLDQAVNILDIANHDDLKIFLRNNNFDIIFHLAAQTQVGDALLNPIRTFKTNIEGTWNLLEINRELNLPIVVASSDKAYGISEQLPYKEDFNLKGEFPYEVSKSVTDLLVNTYKKTYGQNVVSMRCGNIYGGGDLNWERLIPGVIKWLLNNETPVLRSDGTYRRDWVYVEDVAKAYFEVGLKLMNNKVPSIAYNFSSSDNFSVKEVYDMLSLKIKNKIVEPRYVLSSDLEIPDQYLDSSLINKELGIISKVNLDTGLDMTIDWYKEYLKL